MRDVQNMVLADDASTRAFVNCNDFIDAREACTALMRLLCHHMHEGRMEVPNEADEQ